MGNGIMISFILDSWGSGLYSSD